MDVEKRKKWILDNLIRLEKDIEVLNGNIKECRDRISLIETEIDAEKFDFEFDLESGLEIIRLF